MQLLEEYIYSVRPTFKAVHNPDPSSLYPAFLPVSSPPSRTTSYSNTFNPTGPSNNMKTFTSIAAILGVASAYAAPLTASSLRTRATQCDGRNLGILEPASSSTITQTKNGIISCTTIPVLYCSYNYEQTASLSVDVLLSSPSAVTTNGQILVRDATPNPAEAGYPAGYLINATVCPQDRDYPTGQWVLSVFETATGK
jgi:hypothetical protein